ncbi:MAG: prepilin-type N-terminal cleavage/methylation domain-containing protein [Patescibacteria group bacterium]
MGFTLIELLVVTAIIGMITGIVLAALTNARNRAFDTAVKDNLGNIRTQAGIFHTNNGHYGDGLAIPTDCFNPADTDTMFKLDSLIGGMIDAAEDANRANTVRCTTDTTSSAKATLWSVESPLIEGDNWCVDSEGSAKIVTGNATNGACPSS